VLAVFWQSITASTQALDTLLHRRDMPQTVPDRLREIPSDRQDQWCVVEAVISSGTA
jgi:hypothetical protein